MHIKDKNIIDFEIVSISFTNSLWDFIKVIHFNRLIHWYTMYILWYDLFVRCKAKRKMVVDGVLGKNKWPYLMSGVTSIVQPIRVIWYFRLYIQPYKINAHRICNNYSNANSRKGKHTHACIFVSIYSRYFRHWVNEQSYVICQTIQTHGLSVFYVIIMFHIWIKVYWLIEQTISISE